MNHLQTPNEFSIQTIESYYRLHSKIYDITRWSFLFGRTQLIKQLINITSDHTPTRILEIGCGTGANLVKLCRGFPHAKLVGVDVSTEMLARARKKLGAFADRVELLNQSYAQPLTPHSFDLILFSYTLSMINPGYQQFIEQASQDLTSSGLIAVVDFNDAILPLFKRWMQINHVKMDGHLLPGLNRSFQSTSCHIHAAYGGLWSYLIFIGKHKEDVICPPAVPPRSI